MTASRYFVVYAAVCLLIASFPAQSPPSAAIQKLLQPDAQVIETANINAGTGKSFALVLWMEHPQRVMRQAEPSDDDQVYCGDNVYGNYWVGPTKVSLVDLSKSTLVNTVDVRPSYAAPGNQTYVFQIPFLVPNFYYHVPRPNAEHEGKPAILNLKDLTGEGVRGQFVLYEYAYCGITSTTVFGYSPRSGRVTQYPVEIVEGTQTPRTELWVPQIFGRKPVSPGQWEFAWEPGHGKGVNIHEQVSFDKERQLFVDKQELTPFPEAFPPR